MKLLICGDRYWRDFDMIAHVLDELKPTCVINGDALGADTIARQAALARGIPVMNFPAAWNYYGKAAGPMRNRWQFHLSGAEAVIGFHANIAESKGTKDMLSYAASKGVPPLLYDANGNAVVYS